MYIEICMYNYIVLLVASPGQGQWLAMISFDRRSAALVLGALWRGAALRFVPLPSASADMCNRHACRRAVSTSGQKKRGTFGRGAGRGRRFVTLLRRVWLGRRLPAAAALERRAWPTTQRTSERAPITHAGSYTE